MQLTKLEINKMLFVQDGLWQKENGRAENIKWIRREYRENELDREVGKWYDRWLWFNIQKVIVTVVNSTTHYNTVCIAKTQK